MANASTAFISYSRADSEFVLRLAADLKAAGANVWLDQLDIEPGTRWDSAVEDALMNSAHMLVILSSVSVVSDNVRDEVSYALSQQMKVIPVLVSECKVPFRLARLQHIDFRNDYPTALRSLLKTLRVEQIAQQPATVPAAPQPAPDALAEAAERQRALEEARLQAEREQQLAQKAKQEEELKQREQAEAARQAAEAEKQRIAAEQAEQKRKQEQQARQEEERRRHEQAEAARRVEEAEKQRLAAALTEQERRQEQQAKQEEEGRQREQAEASRRTEEAEKQTAAPEPVEHQRNQKQQAKGFFGSYLHPQNERLQSSIQAKTPWLRIARYALVYGAGGAFAVVAQVVLYRALNFPMPLARLIILSGMTITGAVLSAILMCFKPQLTGKVLLLIAASWFISGFVIMPSQLDPPILLYRLGVFRLAWLALGLLPYRFLDTLSFAIAGAATGFILATALRQPRRVGVAVGLISFALPELLFQWYTQRAEIYAGSTTYIYVFLFIGPASYIYVFLVASFEAALLLWFIRDWRTITLDATNSDF